MRIFLLLLVVIGSTSGTPAIEPAGDSNAKVANEDLFCPPEPIVDISSGSVKGIYGYSRKGKKFASFRGIPYAQPPIGDLRFRAPLPAKPWNGTFDASKDGQICIQNDFILHRKPNVTGSEDCLFINVYTPSERILCNRKGKNLLPVMVNIHWGGNIAGSSKSTILGPELLLDKPVILVTFNYRLGIFGFFSSLTDDAPGNWGPKDQVLALRWVQANIVNFGGDKDRVTIFGTSAGAGAVHHLILSPSARGLYHRAISQSGCALNLWARPFNAIQSVIFQAVAQGAQCDKPHSSTADVVDCLRHADTNLLMSIDGIFKYYEREPTVTFSYVTEEKTPNNPEPFLEQDPLTIIQSGDFNKVPWILGTNQDEGALKSAPYVRFSKARETLNSDFDKLMSRNLILEASVPARNISDLWFRIKEFYMGNFKAKIDLGKPLTYRGVTDMYTDRAFAYGMYQSALLHSMKGHSNIWFYNFAFRGRNTYADVFADTDELNNIDFGVSHCDELLYLFNCSELFPNMEFSNVEASMSKFLVSLWTNFAKTGNPYQDWPQIPDLSERTSVSNNDLHYLEIRSPYNLQIRNDYRRNNMNFWVNQKVFENVPGIEP